MSIHVIIPALVLGFLALVALAVWAIVRFRGPDQ